MILTVSALSLTTSCTRETLENNTTTASFDDLEELVSGRISSIYASLRSNALYRNSGVVTMWAGGGIDNFGGAAFFVPEFIPLYTYSYGPGTLIIEQTWTEFYIAIKQINTFLGQIESFEDSSTPDERNPAIGEARFLRAMLYFDMVKIWGDIPLAVNTDLTLDTVREDAGLANSPAEEVYLQIIEDLEFAVQNAPSRIGGSQDIASREAAQVLLGKVYLQMTTTKQYGGVEGGIDSDGNPVSVNERFMQAEEILGEIIASGAFALEPNYADVFTPENENNDEVIFAVGFDGPNNQVGSDYGDFLGRGNLRDGGGFGVLNLNIDFAFEYLRPDGITDPDGTGETISADNLLLAVDPTIIDATLQTFSIPAALLGPNNFVGDERWDNNVTIRDLFGLAPAARGEVTLDPLTEFNLNNASWFNWSPLKYVKPFPNPNENGDGLIDFPYLRYAEVLLLQAEALNALGRTEEARTLVNQVITRSIKPAILEEIPEFSDPGDPSTNIEYLSPTVDSEGTPENILTAAVANNLVATDPIDYLIPSGLSQEEMLDAILLERNKELCFEGKRKDDLIRTGKLEEVVSALHQNSSNPGLSPQVPVRENFSLMMHTHWPIPQREISLNPNLQQNCAFGSSPAGCFDFE